MLLVDPTYLSTDEFLAMYGSSNFDLTTDQLETLLQSASAEADSIMRRTLFATEVVEYIRGNGTGIIQLQRRPIAYVSQINFAQPGLTGYPIARQNVLINYTNGQLELYQPITLQGTIGAVSAWPMNVNIAIRYAYGYGYQPVAPQWTATDTPFFNSYSSFSETQFSGGNYSLAPGSYDVAVTAATPWGETTAVPKTCVTASGALAITVQTVLGAERYRVYMSPTGSGLPFYLCSEVPATTFSMGQLTATITAYSPLDNNVQATLPDVDTSLNDYPSYVKQAVYWLATDAVAQIDNPSNSGIIADVDLKFGQIGQFSKGVSPNYTRAINLLAPKKLNTIFST